MEVGELFSLLNNKKEKVKIEERFDLKCYTAIQKAIHKNDTILTQIIDHHNTEFNRLPLGNYTDKQIKTNLQQIIGYFKDEQIKYQNEVEKNKGMIEIGFMYDVAGPKKQESELTNEGHKVRVDYNLYSSYAQNEYLNQLKVYIMEDLNSKIQQQDLKTNVFLIQMASKKEIMIDNKNKRAIEPYKKKTIDTFIDFLRTNKEFQYVSNQSFVPQWLDIEYNINSMLFNSLHEKLKPTLLRQGRASQQPNYFRLLLFILNKYHRYVNLDEKLKIITKTQKVSTLHPFTIKYTTKYDEKKTKNVRKIFDEKTKIAKSTNEKYGYAVANYKFFIDKSHPSFLKFQNSNDMREHRLYITQMKNSAQNLTESLIAKMKPIKMKQGISYKVKLFSKVRPDKGVLASGILEEYEIPKKQNMISNAQLFSSSNLYLGSEKRIKDSSTFYYVENFYVNSNIIKAYQEELGNNEDMYLFMVELFSNEEKFNDFYTFCSTHDDQTISSLTKEKISPKNIIENQLKLLIQIGRPFYLDTSKMNTSEKGTYVNYEISYYNTKKYTPKKQQEDEVIVEIYVTPKKKSKEETPTNTTNTNKTSNTFSDSCKKKKKSFFNMTKKWINDKQDTLHLWKLQTIGGDKKKKRMKTRKRKGKRNAKLKKVFRKKGKYTIKRIY